MPNAGMRRTTSSEVAANGSVSVTHNTTANAMMARHASPSAVSVIRLPARSSGAGDGKQVDGEQQRGRGDQDQQSPIPMQAVVRVFGGSERTRPPRVARTIMSKAETRSELDRPGAAARWR